MPHTIKVEIDNISELVEELESDKVIQWDYPELEEAIIPYIPYSGETKGLFKFLRKDLANQNIEALLQKKQKLIGLLKEDFTIQTELEDCFQKILGIIPILGYRVYYSKEGEIDTKYPITNHLYNIHPHLVSRAEAVDTLAIDLNPLDGFASSIEREFVSHEESGANSYSVNVLLSDKENYIVACHPGQDIAIEIMKSYKGGELKKALSDYSKKRKHEIRKKLNLLSLKEMTFSGFCMLRLYRDIASGDSGVVINHDDYRDDIISPNHLHITAPFSVTSVHGPVGDHEAATIALRLPIKMKGLYGNYQKV